MGKVAGDLAIMYLQSDVPDEAIEFHYIELIGLTCRVYKLEMDFLKSKSTLFCGEHELQLNNALNRLILEMEQNGSTVR